MSKKPGMFRDWMDFALFVMLCVVFSALLGVILWQGWLWITGP